MDRSSSTSSSFHHRSSPYLAGIKSIKLSSNRRLEQGSSDMPLCPRNVGVMRSNGPAASDKMCEQIEPEARSKWNRSNGGL